MNHNYKVGDTVQIRRGALSCRYIGTVQKVTKCQVAVHVEQFNETIRYAFDKYGCCNYKNNSGSFRNNSKFKYTGIKLIEPDKVTEAREAIERETREREEKLEQDRQAEKARKQKEHEKRLQEIEDFWKAEGEKIWNKRKSLLINNNQIELTVLERGNRVVMFQIRNERDEFESARQGKPVINKVIERGGVEVYESSWGGTSYQYPSFWSGSSYWVGEYIDWRKDVVFNELGRR